MTPMKYLIVVLLALGLATAAGATVPDADLIGLADEIVVGTVVSAARQSENGDTLSYRIAVDRVLKGAPVPAITVRQVVSSARALEAVPQPEEQHLFFLRHDPRGFTLLERDAVQPANRADTIAALLLKPLYTLRIAEPLRPCVFGQPLQVYLLLKNLTDTRLECTNPRLEGVLDSPAMGDQVLTFTHDHPLVMAALPAEAMQLAPGEERQMEFYVATAEPASWQPLSQASLLRSMASVRAIATLIYHPLNPQAKSLYPAQQEAATAWAPLEIGFSRDAQPDEFVTSAPVITNGVEFQGVANAVWPLPGLNSGKVSTVFLGLRVTNHGDKPLAIDTSDTVQMSLRDSQGHALPMGGGNNLLRVARPFLLAPGETRTLPRTAAIIPMPKLQSWVIRGGDETGGVWDFTLPQPGAYSLSFAYDNTYKPTDQLGTPGAPIWRGKAVVPPVSVSAVAE